MEKYKFQKDYDHYKKGDEISVKKVNKLLAKLIDEKIVSKLSKPKK